MATTSRGREGDREEEEESSFVVYCMIYIYNILYVLLGVGFFFNEALFPSLPVLYDVNVPGTRTARTVCIMYHQYHHHDI